MRDHQEMHCAAVVIECDGCKQEVKRPDILMHSETCPEAIVICEYVRFGCGAAGMRRKEMEEHLRENTELHLRLLAASHGRLQSKVSALHEELKEVKERVAPLEDIVYSTFEGECVELSAET